MSGSNELPVGWEMTTLADIGEIISGGTPSTAVTEYWNGDINWISPVDLSGYAGKYITKGKKSITALGLQKSSAKVMPKGSVLFSSRAPIGYVAIAADELSTNQGFKSIIPGKSIFNEYLYYFLKYAKKQAEDLASGTTFKEISLTNFSKIKIPIPPLAEQYRIVAKIEELFSNLDKGIERLKAAQQQLKIYRQSVLKWAFEGKLTDNRNIKWKTLGELCDGVEYGSAAKSKEEGEIPVIRMGNLQNGRIDWSDLLFTDDPEEIKKYMLYKYDVLFNRTNSPEWVGKTAIYKGERPAIFAGYLIRIRYNQNMLNPDYLNYYLNSQEAKNYGNTVKSFGVNQSNINGTKLKGYPFPFTSLLEQQRIVSEVEDRLSVCDKVEEFISRSLQQIEALRQSILKQAFEGKLVLQDP